MVHVTGSPATCVNLALYQLASDCDLVLSGPNIGHNVGRSAVLSSGTVGAAMEGVIAGRRAMAVSFPFKDGFGKWSPEEVGSSPAARASLPRTITGYIRCLCEECACCGVPLSVRRWMWWARRQIDSAVTAAGETVSTLWDEVGPPPTTPVSAPPPVTAHLVATHTSAAGMRVRIWQSQTVDTKTSGLRWRITFPRERRDDFEARFCRCCDRNRPWFSTVSLHNSSSSASEPSHPLRGR